MSFFENHYYNLNRRFLLSVGLWPYQNTKTRRIKRIFTSFFLLQGMIMQLTVFITTEYNIDIFLKVFSFAIMYIAGLFEYNMIYIKSNRVKHLFEQIRYNWRTLIDTEEIEIIQQFANKGRFFTILFILAAYIGGALFLASLFIPDFLDIVVPLNEPRKHQLPFSVEYFVDQEKYFYVIILNLSICAFLLLQAMMATETLYMICIQHACGLFKLTSYRILKVFDNRSQQINTTETKCTICIRLSRAIKTHCRSLEFTEYVCSTFSASYLILCALGVLSFSINLFRLLDTIDLKKRNEIISCGIYVFSHFVAVFWGNYFGQELIDNSADVFEQICNAPWYIAPSHVKKKILFMLHRSSKKVLFNIVGVIVFSFEGCATLVNMAISYCMLIYSVHT